MCNSQYIITFTTGTGANRKSGTHSYIQLRHNCGTNGTLSCHSCTEVTIQEVLTPINETCGFRAGVAKSVPPPHPIGTLLHTMRCRLEGTGDTIFTTPVQNSNLMSDLCWQYLMRVSSLNFQTISAGKEIVARTSHRHWAVVQERVEQNLEVLPAHSNHSKAVSDKHASGCID
jgi:hypothetical protein